MYNRNRCKLYLRCHRSNSYHNNVTTRFIQNEHILKFLFRVKNIECQNIFETMCIHGCLDKIIMIIKYSIEHIIFHKIHAYRAKYFKLACINGHLSIVKWFMNTQNMMTPNIDTGYSSPIISALTNNNLSILKCILQYTKDNNIHADLHFNNEFLFYFACCNNLLDIAKYFIQYTTDINSPIDIHIQHEYIFRLTCMHGTLEIIKWLLLYAKNTTSPIDIHVKEDEYFGYLIRNGKDDIIIFLLKYAEDIENPYESWYYVYSDHKYSEKRHASVS